MTMRIFLKTAFVITIFLCSLPFFQVNAVEPKSATPQRVLLRFNKLEIANDDNRTRWEFTITNESNEAIRLSRFSLISVFGTVIFSDKAGHKWQVEAPKTINDPPPLKVDYSLIVPGNGSTNGVAFTALLKNIALDPSKKRPESLREFTYGFTNNIDAVNARSWTHLRCSGIGQGTVPVQWTTNRPVQIR
jgi:hypothetical protein